MKNIHFTGEWFDCHTPKTMLSDSQAIKTCCLKYMARRHLPISYEYFTDAAFNGVIGTMTGRDVHIIVRTFPLCSTVKAELFVEEGTYAEIGTAMQVFDGLRDEFRPMRALLHRKPCCGQPWPAQGRLPRSPTEVFLPRPQRYD